ncbi:MAG: polysaccharide deacetylase family protein [Proteobacteria bacterium]|nr:polysaccharide deacetylase family protein [Pseudomonadota bacterium]
MSALWSPLRAELGRWRDAGLVLPLWWRDDDAVADTPALRRLSGMAAAVGLPVHIAVIPEGAGETLAHSVAETGNLIPLVHGLAHRNRAGEGEKKAEFGAHRPLPALEADAKEGLRRLAALFGAPLAPVFVPPWNRVAPALLPRLPGLGFRAVSAFGPRTAARAAPGLVQVNTHLDPIDWRGTRGLIAPGALVARMVRDLERRRAGLDDALEPYGVLTHHLVHDAEIWSFCEDLAAVLSDGPIRAWDARKDLG